MKSNMLYIMGVFLMSDNLEKTLYSIKQNLGSSIDQFKLLEAFLLHLDNHISLLEGTFVTIKAEMKPEGLFLE